MPDYLFDKAADIWRGMGNTPDIIIPSRDTLGAFGDYFPDASNTGLLDPTVLVATGASSYSSVNDGQTISNRWFTGNVNLNGISNLKFKNCRFDPATSGRTDRGTVMGRNANNIGIKFEDCEFRNTFTDPMVSAGYMGRGTTFTRCNISGSVDGIGAAPAGASDRTDDVLQGCWIHGLLYVRPYSGQSDNQTHSDGLQWHGGPGLTLLGNRIEGFMDTTISNWALSDWYPGKQTTSVIMVNSSDSFLPTAEMHIVKNWINGGAVGINMVGSPTRFLTNDGSEIVGNRFGYDFGFGANSAIYCNVNHVFTLTGNVRWNPANPMDASTPFNVRTHG